MSIILTQDKADAVVSGDGTKTLVAGRQCWKNQLVVTRGTATAGTLTIKYTIASKTLSLKDAAAAAITVDLAADPDPVVFEGLVDAVVVEQTGVNGTFNLLLLGSQ